MSHQGSRLKQTTESSLTRALKALGGRLAAPSLRCDGWGVCRRQELGGRRGQAPDATLVHLGEKTEPGFYNRRTGCSPAGDPVLSRPQRPRIVGQSPIGDILPG